MICVIPHIHKDAKDHSDSDHRKQVNNVIKTLFSGASEEEIAATLDVFRTEYTEFGNKIGSFDADEFIWKSKDIRYGNSHVWHQKYSLPFTKVIGFVACGYVLFPTFAKIQNIILIVIIGNRSCSV